MTPQSTTALAVLEPPPARLDARAALAAPPRPRPGMVPRARLVGRLAALRRTPVALVVAPAGYGKTTLLAEWAAADPRPFGWLSLARRPADDALHAVLSLTERDDDPQVLVVDDAQAAEPAALRRLLDAAAGLPEGTTLALSSRRYPGEPAGRLRAQRLLADVTARELAMTRLEAERLLRAVGAPLAGEAIDDLHGRTEGWPAALYLAAVARAEEGEDTVAGFSGADRLVAEFLRDELLAELAPEQRAFLRRTSVLSTLTAPLCDAVLGEPGSAAALDALVRAGVPLAPADRCEMAFRCHPLLLAMLRAELSRAEPDLEPVLHRRAAAWLAARGEPAEAIGHAVAGGDRVATARLLWALAAGDLAAGRGALVDRHLAVFRPRELGADASLSLVAAGNHLVNGRRGPAELALEAVERALAAGPEDRERSAAAAILRAGIARRGAAQMAADAARAGGLAAPESGWQVLSLLLAGVAAQLAGERERSVRRLTAALHRADGLPAVTALCRAQLALAAAESGAWTEAAEHARLAHAAATAAGAPPPISALAFTVVALAAAERGDVAQARHDAADARRLLAGREDYPPWLLAEAHAWLARAEIRLSDGPAARMLLSRAARLESQVPDAPALARWIHEGWELADAFAASATGGGPSLTNAELRVLRFLPSHMSFREVGERLHLSTNTVKTQALAVYRKLDVSCRSDAVARGRVAGLIDG